MKTIITTLSLIALLNMQSFAVIIPEDAEGYVDDIPFNTELIAARIHIQEFAESNVNDIPFNTSEIAARTCICEEDEAYVDDIPFDTQLIAARELIPEEEEWNSPDNVSLAIAPCEYLERHFASLEPVLNIQVMMNEIEGMVFELSQIVDQHKIEADFNHEELILEINRVVTEDMMNLFGEQTLLKIF